FFSKKPPLGEGVHPQGPQAPWGPRGTPKGSPVAALWAGGATTGAPKGSPVVAVGDGLQGGPTRGAPGAPAPRGPMETGSTGPQPHIGGPLMEVGSKRPPP